MITTELAKIQFENHEENEIKNKKLTVKTGFPRNNTWAARRAEVRTSGPNLVPLGTRQNSPKPKANQKPTPKAPPA